MEPSDSIAKLGLPRWYERQLIEAHAWLVTCILCGVVVAASLEGLSLRAHGWEPVLRLVFVVAAAPLGWHAWSRYRNLMTRAMRVSDGAICSACGTHGHLQVVGSAGGSISVRCRNCSHAWVIE
jgi:hypothetical protein